MAGTIVADTLQNGAGTSTSMDNAINGSAKAWVNWTYAASVLTIRASYNTSSVTRTGAGAYTVNFTNAFVDTNYVIFVNAGYATNASTYAPITTVVSSTQVTVYPSGGSSSDPPVVSVACFR